MTVAKSQSKPAVKFYESREKEPYGFYVAEHKPTRNFNSGRLEWEIAGDDIERFERHHFVEIGRVVPKLIQESGS